MVHGISIESPKKVQITFCLKDVCDSILSSNDYLITLFLKKRSILLKYKYFWHVGKKVKQKKNLFAIYQASFSSQKP